MLKTKQCLQRGGRKQADLPFISDSKVAGASFPFAFVDSTGLFQPFSKACHLQPFSKTLTTALMKEGFEIHAFPR